MCGFGDKDRRNITPAPVLKLVAKTKEGKIVTGDALCRQAFMVNADLWLEDEVTERNLVLISSIASTKSPTRSFTYMSEPHASAEHGEHGGERGYTTDPMPIHFAPPRTSVITFPYQNNHQGPGPWPSEDSNSSQYPNRMEAELSGESRQDRTRRYEASARGPIDEYEFYHYGEPSDWENLSTPNLVGQTTVGGQSAPDLDGKTTYIWFAFNMLSIRTEGVFKLRFTLCDVMQMNGTTTKVLYQVFSDPIYVQSPKKFLGACAVHSVRFKRKRIDGAGEAGQGRAGGAASANGGGATEGGVAAVSGRGSGLYLDTIRRYMLDFDFEKVCSVSLSNLNVYACLVCGKYFQGRGTTSHAYFHSLHENHHVYINLNTLKVYVLPDSYEVTDSSLDDIKYVLDPRFTHAQVKALDKNSSQSFDLNRKPYIPGFIGLNNIKANDYVNVVVQVLAHIPHIRDFFMLQKFDDKSELVKRFGTLVRKIWNPSAFKGQVSPHELLQEISNASNRQFKLTEQSDPLAFLSWFLNTLHKDLGGTRKKDSSIIYTTFQGELSIETQPIDPKAVKGADLAFNSDDALELPPPPLFHDELEKNIIPQIPLTTILAKYDGKTLQESVSDLKKFQITRLPNYIILHIKRFSKNSFVKEKNPTIVTFPIKNLSMAEFVADPEKEKVLGLQYDLLANITHEGDPSIPNTTSYKVHLQHRAKEQWYQIQDLFVEEINAQMIFLSESYIQVWERKTSN
ncbi:hypothetical protein EC991_011019 [Linnemannia zychae]|nr:hypothetical protein EC991_011019 [Linnemannia zychae]